MMTKQKIFRFQDSLILFHNSWGQCQKSSNHDLLKENVIFIHGKKKKKIYIYIYIYIYTHAW